MLTRAFLLFLAMMTGLAADQSAGRSRLVAGSQLASAQLLSDVQAERVERRVALLSSAQKSADCEEDQLRKPFRAEEILAFATTIYLSDRPRT